VQPPPPPRLDHNAEQRSSPHQSAPPDEQHQGRLDHLRADQPRKCPGRRQRLLDLTMPPPAERDPTFYRGRQHRQTVRNGGAAEGVVSALGWMRVQHLWGRWMAGTGRVAWGSRGSEYCGRAGRRGDEHSGRGCRAASITDGGREQGQCPHDSPVKKWARVAELLM
jgi:hypothetical protein